MKDSELNGKIHSAVYYQCRKRGCAAPAEVLVYIGMDSLALLVSLIVYGQIEVEPHSYDYDAGIEADETVVEIYGKLASFPLSSKKALTSIRHFYPEKYLRQRCIHCPSRSVRCIPASTGHFSRDRLSYA